jgi:hypothetical protein
LPPHAWPDGTPRSGQSMLFMQLLLRTSMKSINAT